MRIAEVRSWGANRGDLETPGGVEMQVLQEAAMRVARPHVFGRDFACWPATPACREAQGSGSSMACRIEARLSGQTNPVVLREPIFMEPLHGLCRKTEPGDLRARQLNQRRPANIFR